MSGRPSRKIKSISAGKLLVITPGIRDEDAPADDQKRRTTARSAILAGADYLVIGRPIADRENPRAEAERFVAAMQAAFDERER